MAQRNEREQDETVLLAHVKVHMISGDSFELLPFEDPNDVKSRVSDLIGDWSKSGFLVRGSRIYPWHQVRLIEATSVEELSRGEARQRQEEWAARDVERLQQSFWRTKQPREKDKEGENGEAEAHPH